MPAKGRIYEIGSGFGVIGVYLAEKSKQREVIEVDINKKKLLQATSQTTLRNIQFIEGNALTYRYKPHVGVVLSDFLHHLSFDDQIVTLERISKKITKGGIVVIKEIDKGDGIFMLMSRLWDFIFYPYDDIYYRNVKDWKNIMQKLRFRVTISREVRWFPGSTYLFVCKKV